jgi:hypothetical protein
MDSRTKRKKLSKTIKTNYVNVAPAATSTVSIKPYNQIAILNSEEITSATHRFETTYTDFTNQINYEKNHFDSLINGLEKNLKKRILNNDTHCCLQKNSRLFCFS